MRMLLQSLLAASLVASGGCRDAPLAPPQDAAARSVVDGAHGGPSGFYFLPPLTQQPSFGGTFDANVLPVVRICRGDGTACGPVVAEFTMLTGPGSEAVRVESEAEHYIVNWHTDQFELDPGSIYRIQVLESGEPLGHADVQVVGSGRELKSVNTGDAIPLLNGRTLPVKFRIEAERGDPGATVELQYICGNAFRVRSYGDSEVTFSYEVDGTDERGEFTLPRPARGNDHADGIFVTQQTGTVRLSSEGVAVAVRANDGRDCTASDRPEIPNSAFPVGHEYVTPMPQDTSVSFFRRQVRVAFYDTASVEGIFDFFARHRAVIVGGARFSNMYYLLIPDPGPDWASYERVLDAMQEEPITDLVGSATAHPILLHSRYPVDGDGFSRQAWSDDNSVATGVWQAVRAPLAWGCETGEYGGGLVRVGVLEGDFYDAHRDLESSLVSVFRPEVPTPFAPLHPDLASLRRHHGTAVAGTLSAEGDNQIGTAGMIWRSHLV